MKRRRGKRQRRKERSDGERKETETEERRELGTDGNWTMDCFNIRNLVKQQALLYDIPPQAKTDSFLLLLVVVLK